MNSLSISLLLLNLGVQIGTGRTEILAKLTRTNRFDLVLKILIRFLGWRNGIGLYSAWFSFKGSVYLNRTEVSFNNKTYVQNS